MEPRNRDAGQREALFQRFATAVLCLSYLQLPVAAVPEQGEATCYNGGNSL